MTAEISPALQSLRLEQAAAFTEDAKSRLIDSDPLTFYRWVADRQMADARRFANAARKERDAAVKAPATLEELIVSQRVNDGRNQCDCVHCAPYLRAVHGNGCSGQHCHGTCIKVPLERCGRCGKTVRLTDITTTGPYRACPDCTAIIRN